MKKLVLVLAAAGATAVACAPRESNPDVARWEQQAASVTIVRDDWGIPHVYGKTDADAVFGVIHPPQVAIVGFGRIREEPWAEAGMLGARPVLTATLAADHRASDGHRGGLFLSALERLLKTPEAL